MIIYPGGRGCPHHFRYIPLTLMPYFWDDGNLLNAWTDRNRFADEAGEGHGRVS
jgi:hypothetical protein